MIIHTRIYLIRLSDFAANTEEYREYEASCLCEALMMAERDAAGIADRAFAICPEDYALARQEGIAFNEADGLLI